MTAAAAEAWKTLFLHRLEEAGRHCRMIPWKITHARAFLAAPLHEIDADFPGGPTRIVQTAEQALGDAAGNLYAAAYLLGSATELALRGGAPLPCNPLPDIRRIPHTAAPQKEASRKLREARLFATEAYDAVELCCDYLLGIRVLLDCPLLPGVNDLIDHDRLNAYDLLEKVREIADDCVMLAAGAREDVSVSIRRPLDG